MRALLLNQRKTLFITVLIVVILFGINLALSFFLRSNYSDALDSCTGSNSLIHFHPTLNKSGSFINLRLGLKYSKPLSLALMIVGSIFSFLCLVYFLYLKQVYNARGYVVLPVTFMLATCLGRFVECILWDYAFDFIAIKEIAIFDVLDFYILAAWISFLVTAVRFQGYENKAKRGLSKKEKHFYNAQLHKDFLKLWGITK